MKEPIQAGCIVSLISKHVYDNAKCTERHDNRYVWILYLTPDREATCLRYTALSGPLSSNEPVDPRSSSRKPSTLSL
jgi:hypothetical protein